MDIKKRHVPRQKEFLLNVKWSRSLIVNLFMTIITLLYHLHNEPIIIIFNFITIDTVLSLHSQIIIIFVIGSIRINIDYCFWLLSLSLFMMIILAPRRFFALVIIIVRASGILIFMSNKLCVWPKILALLTSTLHTSSPLFVWCFHTFFCLCIFVISSACSVYHNRPMCSKWKIKETFCT